MPSKKELFISQLGPFISSFTKTGKYDELIKFLIENSNLPGRRGNLELASAFVSMVKQENDTIKFFQLCKSFLKFDAKQAPTNNPKEFLPFCGIWAIGCLGRNEQLYDEILEIIEKTAHDSRWRVREAVANSIQCLIQEKIQIFDILQSWIHSYDWLLFRSIAAGVADPLILQDKKIAKIALDLHREIFQQILDNEDVYKLRSEEFKVLQKGLSYTLSVVVAAIPDAGFLFIENLLANQSQNSLIIQRIIKENLKKKRLTGKFPNEIIKLTNSQI